MNRKTSIVFLLVFLLSSFNGYHPDDEQKIKFLFIKNFIKNVEWPSDYLKKEFKIGVLGNDKIYDRITMAKIKPDHVNGLSVAYYYFASEEYLKDCHLIYVPDDQSEYISEVIAFYKNKPVLVVTEAKNMCEKGAMINFTHDDKGKLSFEYNVKALSEVGLEYSAKFMEQGQDAL
jgi:hypothetical protein